MSFILNEVNPMKAERKESMESERKTLCGNIFNRERVIA